MPGKKWSTSRAPRSIEKKLFILTPSGEKKSRRENPNSESSMDFPRAKQQCSCGLMCTTSATGASHHKVSDRSWTSRKKGFARFYGAFFHRTNSSLECKTRKPNQQVVHTGSVATFRQPPSLGKRATEGAFTTTKVCLRRPDTSHAVSGLILQPQLWSWNLLERVSPIRQDEAGPVPLNNWWLTRKIAIYRGTDGSKDRTHRRAEKTDE